MNSHAIHNYETALAFSYPRVPAYIVSPALPLHADNRDIHSPLFCKLNFTRRIDTADVADDARGIFVIRRL